MSQLPDDRLFELLGTTLRSGTPPSPAGRSVVRARAEAGLRETDVSMPRRAPRRVGLVLAAAAAAIAIFVGGLVVGEGLPRALRSAAHAIGLPVDSPTLLDAREVLHDLGEAVGRSETDTTTPPELLDEMQALDTRMLGLVAKLDDEEKAKIVPVAHEVHLRAVQVLTEAGRPPPP